MTSADDSAYDPSGVAGLRCVNSGALAIYGVTYAVNFPAHQIHLPDTCQHVWPGACARSVRRPSLYAAAFVLAYTSDSLGHVIYPSGISEADWLHDLPQLAKETWIGP
jgi:hypothetical protein